MKEGSNNINEEDNELLGSPIKKVVYDEEEEGFSPPMGNLGERRDSNVIRGDNENEDEQAAF